MKILGQRAGLQSVHRRRSAPTCREQNRKLCVCVGFCPPAGACHATDSLCHRVHLPTPSRGSETEKVTLIQRFIWNTYLSFCKSVGFFAVKPCKNTNLAVPGGPPARAGAGHSLAGLSPPAPLLSETESLPCSTQVRWEEHRMTPRASNLPQLSKPQPRGAADTNSDDSWSPERTLGLGMPGHTWMGIWGTPEALGTPTGEPPHTAMEIPSTPTRRASTRG